MFRFAQHDREGQGHRSPANGNHFAIWLVIVSKIVCPRLSFDHVQKELLELFITRAGPERFHDVEFEVAAETRTQFPITGKAKFVTILAEMPVRHRADEADALWASRNLVVSGRTISSKFRLWN